MLLCGLGIASWALGAHNVADWNAQIGLVWRGAGMVVLEAGFVWLVYLAVEPYARRLRPWTLVSWTRILGGGFSDPVVGRDALLGLAWAVGVCYIQPLRYALPPLFGDPPSAPTFGYLDGLTGPAQLVSFTLAALIESILYAFAALLLFVVLRSLLRRDALAITAVAALMILPYVLGAGEEIWYAVPAMAVWLMTWIFLLLRFGLLASIVGSFAADVLYAFPITTDLQSWKAGPTLFALPLIALLCVWAFRNAIGGTGLRRYLTPDAPSTP
jgi:hypothetical protein